MAWFSLMLEVLGILVLGVVSSPRWLLLFVQVVMLAIYWYVNIKNKPPHKAILIRLGEKTDKILDEGWHLVLKPLYNVLPINVTKVNKKFTFSHIRTVDRATASGSKKNQKQSGGEIEVEVSVTYQPDHQEGRLNAFVESGMSEGVESIIQALIEEDLRQLGAENDWESYSFGTDELTNKLVKKLTGEDLENAAMQGEFAHNGLPDIRDLGVRLWRLNIGQIKEMGKLAEAAEKRAVEEQERAGEETELEFVAEQIKKMQDLGFSPKEAAELVQSERQKIDITVFRGLENNPLGGLVLTRLPQDIGGRDKKSASDKKEAGESLVDEAKTVANIFKPKRKED